jgi:23S rRNA (cytidine1920-2'-O)/16S rRNA (cytidine1409-2'-O)-methyltransferase
MRRLDHVLLELKLAPTRSKAQQLIEAGEVEVLVRQEWTVIRQSSYSVAQPSLQTVRIKEGSQTLKYVSRGGLKLEGALEHLRLDVAGYWVLDLGISTGGFSDCLLQKGAREICGIDVGHEQLHEKLSRDPRLLVIEGLNVKDIGSDRSVTQWLKSGCDLCVADLSFISLLSVLNVISSTLPPDTKFLGLVKPQFEVGREHLDKRGVVVDDPHIFAELRARILREMEKCGLSKAEYFPSRLRGQDGNQEFFVYSCRG